MSTNFYTKEMCISKLQMWLEAEEAIANSQSYKIGTRELRRADLSEIREQIKFWENKLIFVNNKGKTRRTYRAVPRDL